jgi:hypothetical protein
MQLLPSMFDTHMQKATMCNFLWTNDEDPITIVYYLRLYDMVRRFYFVKTGKEPDAERVLELIDFIKSNKDINDFFMYYCKCGRFPDNRTIQLIKY